MRTDQGHTLTLSPVAEKLYSILTFSSLVLFLTDEGSFATSLAEPLARRSPVPSHPSRTAPRRAATPHLPITQHLIAILRFVNRLEFAAGRAGSGSTPTACQRSGRILGGREGKSKVGVAGCRLLCSAATRGSCWDEQRHPHWRSAMRVAPRSARPITDSFQW